MYGWMDDRLLWIVVYRINRNSVIYHYIFIYMVFGGECCVLAHHDDKVGFYCSVSVEGRHTGLVGCAGWCVI